MIVTEDLVKQIEDFIAVKDVSFQIQAGHVLALLGPNGAAKTNTVRMLTSVPPHSTGWLRRLSTEE